MFPLRDFLQRHGKRLEHQQVFDHLVDLLHNGLGPSADVFEANQDNQADGAFVIEQAGYNQPRVICAEIVVLPDALTAILISTDAALGGRCATTILISSITSATFKLGKICRQACDNVNDE